jgi:hypothetical protein
LLLGGCTMTWVAVMVVPSVVPSTRACWPVVTALTEAWLVPFSYVVEDVSLMVSFWLPEVVSVKPDVDTLLTVPIEPPAAGPDRAFDPPPDPEPPARGKPLLLAWLFVLLLVLLPELLLTALLLAVVVEPLEVAATIP